jgi:hypothetical protein
MPGPLAVAAILVAGCGGVSSVTTTQSVVTGTPVRAVLSSPQSAVRSYIEAIEGLDGNTMCSILDEELRRFLVAYTVRNLAVPAGVPCAETMSRFASAITTPGERSRHYKLPTFHVTITGNRAVVRYIGSASHEPHTIVLVKRSNGWLLDKVNGNG